MTATERFKSELATYEREKSRLVAESEGKFVVIQGADVGGVWDTYVDALNAAYGKFGLTPFLVKQIESVERVHFFPRDLGSCPS